MGCTNVWAATCSRLSFLRILETIVFVLDFHQILDGFGIQSKVFYDLWPTFRYLIGRFLWGCGRRTVELGSSMNGFDYCFGGGSVRV